MGFAQKPALGLKSTCISQAVGRFSYKMVWPWSIPLSWFHSALTVLYLTPQGHLTTACWSHLGTQHSSDLQLHSGAWKSLLLLPRETWQAQGKLNIYLKKVKRFLQFQWILDKALNAGSSQVITQQCHTNKQELLPFQGHCWWGSTNAQQYQRGSQHLAAASALRCLPCWKHCALLSSGQL